MKNCPSCGRPIPFEEKYLKVTACKYCNSVLEFGGGELTKIGEQNDFLDFPSQFEVGRYTEWNDKKVYVKGQVRYEYDGGFFDNFFVIIEDREYYIREDDGIAKLSKVVHEFQNDMDITGLEVGTSFDFGGHDVFIQEKGIFNLASIKGYVNSFIVPGKEYDYIDGVSAGKMIYIEKEQGTSNMRVMMEVD